MPAQTFSTQALESAASPPQQSQPRSFSPGPVTRIQGAINPVQDPSLQRFLARQGISDRQAQATIAQRSSELKRQQAEQNVQFDVNQERGLENIDTGFESAGLFGSGRNIRDRARLESDIARARASFNQDIADQFTRQALGEEFRQQFRNQSLIEQGSDATSRLMEFFAEQGLIADALNQPTLRTGFNRQDASQKALLDFILAGV